MSPTAERVILRLWMLGLILVSPILLIATLFFDPIGKANKSEACREWFALVAGACIILWTGNIDDGPAP